MNIKRIKYYIVFTTMFFCVATLASANVVINEVQLAPTEDRFIELYNSGGSSIDLTDWYIQRKTATGSDFGSLISKTNFEGKSIEAGGYFLISKTDMLNSDIVCSSLTLTESNTIQIKNSEGNVVDKIGWGDSNDCGNICAPNPTEGKSIQRNESGSWILSLHTPGYLNINTQDGINSDNTNNDINVSDSDSNSSSYSSIENLEIFKITTKIIAPKIVVAGIPFSFNSLTTTNRGETYAVGNYVWNFGDGMTSKIKESGPFDYLYEYPGDYAVTLSYFDSVLNKEADATNKINIKVIPSEISISFVGNDKDPFIEIENKSKYEITLSNWIITGGIHYFIIPAGTTILPSKKIKLSPKITGFVGDDLHFVTIENQNKELVATYPIQTEKLIKKSSLVFRVVNNNTNLLDNTTENSQVIDLNDLGASVEKSKINIQNSAYPLLGLFGIIGIGIIGILTLKRKNNISDYVEKEIRAEDMTIIE